MHNPVIDTAHFGSAYSRKINVFRLVDDKNFSRKLWAYAWSKNAAKTCKAAVILANQKEAGVTFRAWFAK